MYVEGKVWLAMNEEKQYILPGMANRHGLIAGATGTGKTVTLKVIAESFSDMGVPVFMADVKGDLSGMCTPGEDSGGMQKRIAKFGLAEYGFSYKKYPTWFWDVYGEKGCPVRVTVSEMGPMLLSHVMGLNDTQTGILEIVFRVADDENMLLLDLKDLKAILNYVSEHASELKGEYGNIASQSVGAIMRGILQLENQGGELFFGEPALELRDWIRTDTDGRGMVHILDGVKLFQNPKLYSAFLLWLLSELYEMMPEAGDLEKPRMLFFFDEAHLLFDDASKALLQKLEQIVRLIRSKGIGIYFITQNPTDIPDDILSQLGNRIQHALHAYSPSEQKAVKAAADSFRPNPAFDSRDVISELGTGEALVSFLDEEGRPGQAERVWILPPQSYMGAVSEEKRESVWKGSEMYVKYNEMIDRESAFEILNAKAMQAAAAADAQQKKKEEEKQKEKESKEKKQVSGKVQRELESGLVRIAKAALPRTSYSRKKSTADRMKDTAMSVVGGQVAKSLIRGLFGTLKK